ncbi:MAG: hypothetical protein AAF348_11880 [Bacteroidota bacterium]
MNFEDFDIWLWIIPILVGIFAGILGYLIGKGKTAPSVDYSSDINALEVQNAKLKADLEICTKRLDVANTPKDQVISALTISEPETLGFDKDAAKIALGKKVKEDDLKIVEGIGPKIEGLFHNFDIKTWKALAETSTDKCQEVLNSGGDRYRIHDPASWPMQAKMAYEGHWKELAKWQDKHKSGKF